MEKVIYKNSYAVKTGPKRRTRKFIKLSLAYCVLAAFIVAAILPIVWIFTTSINASNTLLTTSLDIIPEKMTLNHYKNILFGPNSNFFLWLKNSIIVAGATTGLSLMLGTTAAYAFSRFRFKGRKTLLNIFLLLNAFPNILAIVAYYKIITTLNLVNTLIGLVIVYTGGQLVFTIWNLKGYFDTLPYEIEEAALIDGASVLKIFTKIVLPLSRPAIAVTAMFSFMAGWNEYIFAMTFTTNKGIFTLPVGLWSLQNAGNYAQNWPLFAAGSLIVAVPVMIVFLLLQKSLISGLTLGSTK
ncbi:sugar ABC transporter permease [Fonticella tunisiensis]|uniref:Carbohydrate ABC transporter membrane protein 2 (CUT1 family) n=1 Tax=Fonticella tunisiensis TaxID=1096341 RepID=A0A4V3ES32_9CLOT|nr:sugar ABC transporter permease [Fonticella tunisiensis]TDT52000.1 carbohydrate ABC transporter membrane protein 2 (CUT1 family) [Fonticella tunisiensis]